MSRAEDMLIALVTGGAADIVPRSRMEKYLKNCIEGCGCDGLPEPRSRAEVLLYALAEKIAAGGGGTVKNQHKTFTENGVYRADEGYTGLGTVTVNVPNKLAQVADGSLTEITAKDLQGATKIRQYAFRGCDFTSVTIPKTVSGEIGQNAFEYCMSLSNVTFEPNSNISSIGMSAFSDCRAIEYIDIPVSITEFGRYAFSRCFALKSITIKPNVTKIKSYCFQNCRELKDITIQSTTPTIFKGETSVFLGCGALENFSIASLKIADNYFKLNESPLLTAESMLNILNALEDNTGEETTYTVYFGTTNLAKLTEEQKLIAYDKNIDLA